MEEDLKKTTAGQDFAENSNAPDTQEDVAAQGIADAPLNVDAETAESAVPLTEQQLKKKKRETVFQAIKYACCTASAGVIEFLSYQLFLAVLPIDEGKTMMFLDPSPLSTLIFVSEVLSLALSVLWNFTLNRKFTFKSAANVPKAMGLAFLFYVPFFPFAAWYVPRLTPYIGVFAKLSKMLLNGVLEFMWQKFVIYRNSANTAVGAKK